MKPRLLADENISWRIKRLLNQWEILPANEIVGIKPFQDIHIWNFAKANGYTVLTFDEDFIDLQTLYAFPPKIIWLRTGNVSTAVIAARLNELETSIIAFADNDELGVFEIYL